MACPYFEPLAQRTETQTLLPLRNFWSGACHAGETVFTPDEPLLSECCNMGYARGTCSRFPIAPGPDAVRFTIASDSGRTIVLSFAIEKNHHPHAQGALEFSREDGRFIVDYPDPMIEKQAGAYLATYMRRKPASV